LIAGLVISGRGGNGSLGNSGIVKLPFCRTGKREGDESGDDIEILGDMMSIIMLFEMLQDNFCYKNEVRKKNEIHIP
jgi:hypothetical protein